MAARPALVSQAEIKRTLSAALGAGLRVGKVEIDHSTGKVTIYPEAAGAGGDAAKPDMTPLEKWRAGRASS